MTRPTFCQTAWAGLLCASLILSGCSQGAAAPPAEQTSTARPQAAPSLAAGAAGPEKPLPSAPGPSPAPPETRVIPQAAPSPSPSPTVRAPILRQLTQGGCCVQPFWSPDSQQVLYIDRPTPSAPIGIWSVPAAGGAPTLWSERLGLYSPDLSLRAYPAGGQTRIERLADGQTWTIANGGRAVSFSPDNAQVAWTGGQSGPPFDTAVRQVWVSPIEGGPARQVFAGPGVGFAGWLPGGRLLVTTRLAAPESGQAISVLTPAEAPGQPPGLQEMVRGERLRSLSLSPGGDWLAYVVSFTNDLADSGLWLVELASGQRRKVEPFGAYRWRDAGHLLLVPLEPGAPANRVLQVEASGGAVVPLLDPLQTPFKIANGDWSVSPDGRYMVFVSAHDQNLWLIELP